MACWFVARYVDVAAIVAVAVDAELGWIVVAAMLLPVNLTLEALTWRPVLSKVVSGVGLPETMMSVVSGYPLGMFTPARVGDFAGRALYLRRGNRTEIALSAAVARLPDLLAILTVGSGALTIGLLTGSAGFAGVVLLAVMSYTALVLITTLVAVPSLIRRITAKLPFLKGLDPRLAFIDRLPRSVMCSMFLLALARLCVYATQFALLAFAFAPEAAVAPVVSAVLLTFLAKSVIPPVTFMDLGIREGAASYFFGYYGLGAATGFDAGLMLFGLNLLLPAVLGLPLIWRYRLSARAESTKAPDPMTERRA